MRKGEPMRERILDFIRQELADKGYPPSLREICAAVGVRSTSTVHAHLSALEKEGRIRRDASKPRAMELVDAPRGQSIPLVGRVTAGQPLLAMQNIEEYLVMPHSLGEQDELFALRVQGESMIEAGILDRDIVIVRRQETAENGEIVVAMIEDEATVKRVFFEPKRVRLQPENSAMQPIYASDVRILGRLVGLYRAF